MSVDPSTIVVAVVAAAGAFVQGTGAPPEVKDQVSDTLGTISAPVADQQLSNAIDSLPEPARVPAQQAVDGITAAAANALEPYLPSGSLNPPAPDPEPLAQSTPAPPGPDAGSASTEAQALGELPGTQHPGAGTDRGNDSGLQPIPSILSIPSFAPVGAITLFAPWLRKAGALCEGIKPGTVAALYAAENGFRYGPTAPVSPSGAIGPGQFMPGTWASYGRDADGDGKADVLGIADPVMASGHLLCDMYGQIDTWKQQGRVGGDTLDLTLAAYNAGSGAVLRSGGMPSGTPDYENQTKPYVAKIRANEPSFARMLAPLIGLAGDGSVGGRVVELAFHYLGLPYVWGGGNTDGPSGGGFDCSGLTSYAIHAATGVTLPRTSEMQWNVGQEIPLADVRPGDLLFGNWQSGGPGHVAIYIGDGQMVHAPTTGDVVRIAEVFPDMKARRIV